MSLVPGPMLILWEPVRSSEPFLDMDLNIEALGAISKSKALQELKSSVGFATADKLNDIQANKLLTNMMKMDEFYNPPAAPANITDLATRTRNLDARRFRFFESNCR
jgi:hypothetical protein